MEQLLTEGTVPVPPHTAPALIAIIAYYLFGSYRIREGAKWLGENFL